MYHIQFEKRCMKTSNALYIENNGDQKKKYKSDIHIRQIY